MVSCEVKRNGEGSYPISIWRVVSVGCDGVRAVEGNLPKHSCELLEERN